MSLSAHNARVGLVNKRPRSSLQATEPAATQTPRKSPSSHGNITGSAEPSPQSYFMSLRIWTSLFHFVSIVFHLFVLFSPFLFFLAQSFLESSMGEPGQVWVLFGCLVGKVGEL